MISVTELRLVGLALYNCVTLPLSVTVLQTGADDMKKYATSAERQRAYRQCLKSGTRGRSELRLIVDDTTILALKRLTVRYKNNALAKTLQTAVDRMERGRNSQYE